MNPIEKQAAMAVRTWLVGGVTLLCLAAALLLPPMSQPLAYHDFADRRLLALAQQVVRRLEKFCQELFFGREVPVEDPFADAQRGHDVGH